MEKPTIGVRSAMVAIVMIALVVAVAILGRTLMEQNRRILALEAQARKLQTQGVQLVNNMNKGISSVNKSLADGRRRLEKVERDVAARDDAPPKP